MTAYADGHGQLAAWLGARVPALTAPVVSYRIGSGQSNLTFLLRDAESREWVLRRPPRSDEDGGEHGVLREARILRALATTAVPVPAVVATGAGEAGIDGPFAVTERAPGAVLSDERDAARLPVSERAELGTNVIATLAALHETDPGTVGLAELAPHDGYVARQIRRMSRNWRDWGWHSDADGLWRRCLDRLENRAPRPQRVTLVHGDYRLANVLVDRGRITAVLDWELCTLGDPIADLAWLVDDWRAPEDPAIAVPSPTRAGGFAHRADIVAEYAGRTGLDADALDYYRAFTHWKAATLLQGVLVRRRSGELGEHGAPDLVTLEDTIRYLLHEALDLARQYRTP
ncbi:Predicted kinase, aminoglycoside phosphotransferase (APT) family [Haloechinothrix alba]|uniref:Predicted kinase, aminoglycoside phosphotransferase (APT) family n=1 Tax=Haloechinothrix alba TaxID=664784 RepID=A0A238ZG16_9PSEU|nr:phosphotransferase family protein [Haloechinothrix alba]SNR82446.1 Predicted kinase, aminoglycoside phosphotransferase (APT) family [Haloechinothrix alba]